MSFNSVCFLIIVGVLVIFSYCLYKYCKEDETVFEPIKSFEKMTAAELLDSFLLIYFYLITSFNYNYLRKFRDPHKITSYSNWINNNLNLLSKKSYLWNNSLNIKKEIECYSNKAPEINSETKKEFLKEFFKNFIYTSYGVFQTFIKYISFGLAFLLIGLSGLLFAYRKMIVFSKIYLVIFFIFGIYFLLIFFRYRKEVIMNDKLSEINKENPDIKVFNYLNFNVMICLKRLKKIVDLIELKKNEINSEENDKQLHKELMQNFKELFEQVPEFKKHYQIFIKNGIIEEKLHEGKYILQLKVSLNAFSYYLFRYLRDTAENEGVASPTFIFDLFKGLLYDKKSEPIVYEVFSSTQQNLDSNGIPKDMENKILPLIK